MRLPQTEGSVLPEWIDNNDHMNLAYYVLLFDLATDTVYDALGIGQAYRAATGNSTFTAETHIVYQRELRVRRTTAFAPDVLERLQAAVWSRSGEQLPEGVGRRIAMPAPRVT